MKQIPLAALAAVLLMSTLTFSGCFLLLGAAAGAGGYAWAKGAVQKEFNVTAEKLNNAAIRALKSLDIAVIDHSYDRLTAWIEGSFADGEKVDIKIDAVTEKRAKIVIRVGVMGNKTKSDLIIAQIEKYL